MLHSHPRKEKAVPKSTVNIFPVETPVPEPFRDVDLIHRPDASKTSSSKPRHRLHNRPLYTGSQIQRSPKPPESSKAPKPPESSKPPESAKPAKPAKPPKPPNSAKPPKSKPSRQSQKITDYKAAKDSELIRCHQLHNGISHKLHRGIFKSVELGNYVFFDDSHSNYLSNWYIENFDARFRNKVYTFPTALHYIIFRKMLMFPDNSKTARELLKIRRPAVAQKWGFDKVKNFNKESWDKRRIPILQSALQAKFASPQAKRLKLLLFQTRGKTIIYASKTDEVLGIGYSELDARDNIGNRMKLWGDNELGFQLMVLRDAMFALVDKSKEKEQLSKKLLQKSS